MYHNDKNINKLFLYLKYILSIFFIVFFIEKSFGKNPQLSEMVSLIDGLTNSEVEQLTQSLEEYFQPLIEKEMLDTNILKSIGSIVSAGIFEQAPFNTIAEVAVKAYKAEINGAPSKYVEDLALIGFSFPLTQNQLEMAAKSIKKLIVNGIEPLVIEELISYGIYNGWKGNTIYTVCNGILTGVSDDLEARKLALSFIIGVDQEINEKEVDVIIKENIQFLKTIEQQPQEESNRRNLAYQYLQSALQQGIPRQIVEEIYITATYEKWSADATKAIFEGLINGHKMGLTTEKLAIALLVRMAQGLEKIKPEKMVKQEIEYVKQLEKERLRLINSDNKKYKRKLEPVYQYQLSNIQPEKPEKISQQKPITYYPVTTRNTINEQLMWQTIREFLGPPPTPYRWGGNSRRGIDCSGFTKAVYQYQGIRLPRNSRQQAQTGIFVRDQLKFGDLIFFSKYFNKHITHVGIYIGNGNFVHSSCTKGVTISSLNQRYYRVRYRYAKRIV